MHNRAFPVPGFHVMGVVVASVIGDSAEPVWWLVV
jgi:hypothetical protein